MSHHWLSLPRLSYKTWICGTLAWRTRTIQLEWDRNWSCQGWLWDSHPFCWVVGKPGGSELRPSFVMLNRTGIYILVFFFFPLLDWNQDLLLYPECCCKSQDCRPCPPEDQDRGSMLWEREEWIAHPSRKPSLSHSLAVLLIAPKMLFLPQQGIVQSHQKRESWKWSVGGREAYR